MIQFSKFKILFLLILFFSIFGFAKNSLAATYYVDYTGGSATALGTSTDTAWKYSPGDSRFAAACTGNCATTWTGAGSRLVAGDKVIFKGDVTYTGSLITISWAGNADTTAGRIIYDGDSGTYVSRWGSGTSKAIIDGATTNGGFLANNSSAYITINSFEVKNGQLTRAENPTLIYGYSGASYLTISNNTVHDIGNFAPTGGTYTGTCIQSGGSDYLKIQNNTVYNCGADGILFWPATTSGSNLEISGNNVTDKVSWAIVIPCAAQGNLTSWKIFNNTVHDITYYSRNNGDPHNNFIWLYGSGNYSVTDIEINNNLLYTDGTGYPSSGAIHLESSHGGFNNLKIYNNVLKNIDYASAIYLTTNNQSGGNGTFTDLYIYNNSIYSPNANGGVALYGSILGGYNNVNIKNNIFSINDSSGNSTAIFYSPAITNGIYIDYNLYYSNGTGLFKTDLRGIHNGATSSTVMSDSTFVGDIRTNALIGLKIYNITDVSNCTITSNTSNTITCSAGLSGGTRNTWISGDSWQLTSGYNSYNFTTWKSAYPAYDAHSIGQTYDPLFTDVGATSHNLRLSSDTSPAYEAGVDLSATIGSLDFLGNARSNAWDMGAYEYVSGTTDTIPPAAPSGLSVS